MEKSTCQEMVNRAKPLPLTMRGADNQQRLDSAASGMDFSATDAMKALVKSITSDEATVQGFAARNNSTVKNPSCANSSGAKIYARAESELSQQTSQMSGFLGKLKSAKESAANQLSGMAGKAEISSNAIQSVGSPSAASPKQSGIPDATKAITEHVPALTGNPPEPAVLYGLSAGEFNSQAEPKENLTGLHFLARLAPLEIGSLVADNSGPHSFAPPPSAPKIRGNVSGKYGVEISNEFTDHEKIYINIALSRVPACQRDALRGLKFTSLRVNMTNNPDPNTCEYAQYLPTLNEIQLGTNCMNDFSTKSVSTIVHELMHRLASKKGLDARYEEGLRGRERCPVTDYGTRGTHEDFAEAGRLVLLGDSDPQAGSNKNSGDCVQHRLTVARKLIFCQ